MRIPLFTVMSDLNNIKNKIQSKTAFVIGDAILDCQILGKFTHKSAEANVNVYFEEDVSYIVGGAGNVALNLIEANQKVKFCSVIGSDNYGKILTKLLNKKGIDTSLLVLDDNRKTTLKTRYFVDDTQVFRSDNEDVFDISTDVENALIDICKKEIPLSNIVVISDYAKGVITYSLIEKIVEIATNSGVKTVVDPKTCDFTKYKNCTYIKPNLKEFTEMKAYGNFDGKIENVALDIINKNGNDGIIITLGKKGMTAVDKSGKAFSVDGIDCNVVDVCGAGDTALAYVVTGVVNGFSLDNVISLANKASSVKLATKGAYAVNVNSVISPLKKVVDINNVNLLKATLNGKKVVFTNGCFDIIHKGHVECLKKASKLGDVLVVGVNSDKSVKRLKGNDRPFNLIDSRVSVLSAFSFVDYVVVFDEDTPYNLIKALSPDVLVKGDEYANTQVVGQDIVENNGGKVVFIEMEEGYSTTNVANKIYVNKK
ncbi:MAG: D-glycero-beta-D-manno-heptose 1-phosphate adenylyltransferase [Clostridia bacterium]|nr:D-glycero-beta-D-manno-heptose 1-phosphate adenylyltransferase [Clostridia bacterium]